MLLHCQLVKEHVFLGTEADQTSRLAELSRNIETSYRHLATCGAGLIRKRLECCRFPSTVNAKQRKALPKVQRKRSITDCERPLSACRIHLGKAVNPDLTLGFYQLVDSLFLRFDIFISKILDFLKTCFLHACHRTHVQNPPAKSKWIGAAEYVLKKKNQENTHQTMNAHSP